MKRNKKLMLTAISAMGLVALGTGAVSTFAWYAATNNATVDVLVGNSGTMTMANTTISANNYDVNFSFGDLTDTTPELAHLGSGDSDYINGESGAKYTAGTLYKGVLHFLIHNEVHIPLSVSDIRVRKTMEFFGQRLQGLA